MKRKLVRLLWISSVFCLFLVVAIQSRRSGNVPAPVPPIQQIKVFALSNAPVYASGVQWRTNTPTAISTFSVYTNGSPHPVGNQLAMPKTTYVQFKNGEQEAAFTRLKQSTFDSAQLYMRPDNSTPAQIKGYPLRKAVGAAGTVAEQNQNTALAFLSENASLLLIKDPKNELRLLEVERDNLGMTHLRYSQTYRGLDVWPAQLSVHLDAQGNVTMMDGAHVSTPEGIATVPQITESEAVNLATQLVPSGNQANRSKPSLIVYGPLDKPPRLGWKCEIISGLQNDWIIVIDALNGSSLTSFNQVAVGNVSGYGTDLFGITRPLNVWQNGSTYYMFDASKPMFNATTGDGVIMITDARNQTEDQIMVGNTLQNLSYITSSMPSSWTNPEGVSASYCLSQTYDYYYSRFGRNSYNGGGTNIIAVVRISEYDNACWNPSLKMALFGNVKNFAGCLDIIGHELTHAVISSLGGNGVLHYQNQPGALNEAFADIFGEMVESRTQGTNDWLNGGGLASPSRNLANPSAFQYAGTNNYPSKYSQFLPSNDSRLSGFVNSDNGGVHINCTIISHAFYLLAVGMQGAIGVTNAEQIFYRCLTQSMQPQSQFIDARLGCIAAAEALFGTNSIYALKTAEAFDRVEIYVTPASTVQPATMNAAVNAPDSYMWVRYAWDWGSLSYKYCLYRCESALNDGSGTKLVTGVRNALPSVSGSGLDMFFAGGDDSLCYIETSGNNFSTSYSGQVHAVAWSPDRRYYAFVLNTSTGSPTNQIYLYDSARSVSALVNLKTPVQDGPALNNIVYADTLNFSPNGQLLAYDALSRIRMPDGSTQSVWGIYTITLSNLQQSLLVSPSSGFSFGNPAYSRTSSRFLALDARYTNGNSAILTLDLALGSFGLVGLSQNGYGYPQFNGNDSYIIFADNDSSVNSGRSIYAQALSTDKLSPSGSLSLWISDATLATIYRRGTYTSPYTPPTVSVISPSANASYTSPANVTMAASASSLNGTINRIEFYSGSRLIGTITSTPYTATWSGVPVGNYRIYARVYDSTGASTTSSPVDFTVRPSGGLAQIVPGKAGFEFSLRLTNAGLYRLEYSTNLVNWTTLGTFQCLSNLNFLDAGASNRPSSFYRATFLP